MDQQPLERKTLLIKCFACLPSVAWEFWQEQSLSVCCQDGGWNKVLVKTSLKPFLDVTWLWLLGCCCSCLLYRVQCLDFWGDANSFSSLYVVWWSNWGPAVSDHFSLSVLGWAQCSPCYGQLRSALWSIKPKCFQGGKMNPSAFSACKALVWNVFILHSCLPAFPHLSLTRTCVLQVPGTALRALPFLETVTAAYGLGNTAFFKQITTSLLQLSYWSSPAKLCSICIKRGSSATAQ